MRQRSKIQDREILEQFDLEPEIQQTIGPIIQEFSELFTEQPTQSTTITTTHEIKLKSDKIVNIKPYPINPEKKRILYQQIEEMLTNGVIEPCFSPYSSPPVIVERPDKKPRFCIDFRQLNDITEDEATTLPKIYETIKDFGRAKIFTTLDLKSGYWQIPLEKTSRPYTAFSTPDGAKYQFRVLPFGLKSAPATFQNLMAREVLPGYLHDFVKVYLDDIIVYSESMEEHAVHLRQVFERLRIHQLTVSPTKCCFAKSNLEYLGYRIEGDTTKPLEKHTIAIGDTPAPKTRKQLQSFLGLCNWVREYLPDFAALSKPLTQLLSKKEKFKWTEQCDISFNQIKSLASHPLELHRPDFNKPFILQTDASLLGLGAVLYQLADDEVTKHIVSYSSCSLNKAESKYHIQELECLALVWAIKKYRMYLEHRHFTLLTDNRALVWLEKYRESKSKLTRWSLLLQEFSFTIQHCAGRLNNLPDFLSRNPDQNTQREEINEDRLLPPEDPIRINAIQRIDEVMESAKQAQNGSDPLQRAKRRWQEIQENGPVTRTQETYLNRYEVHDGYIYRKEGPKRKLVIPLNHASQIIGHHHNEDHPGAKETIRRTKKRFYCRGLDKKIYNYVRNCLTCAQIKTRQNQDPAPLRAYVSERPFQVISVDILGPYMKTPRGNRYILAVEDTFSKWMEVKAFPEVHMKTIITYLEEEIISRYGPPETIISDQGKQFLSNTFQRWCRERNINCRCSAIHHQQANPIERRVQEMKKLLRLYTKDKRPECWDEHLHKAMLALRKRQNAATTYTPAQIVLGYELPEYGEWALTAMGMAPIEEPPRAEILANANQHQQNYQKKYAPEELQPTVTLRPGQLVFVRAWEKRDAFHCPWRGPCRVTKRVSPTVYEIDKEGMLAEVHLDDLRPVPRGEEEDQEGDPEDLLPPDEIHRNAEAGAPDDFDPSSQPTSTQEPESQSTPQPDPPPDGQPRTSEEDEADAPVLPTPRIDPHSTGPSREVTQSTPSIENRPVPPRRRRRVRIEIRDAAPTTDV